MTSWIGVCGQIELIGFVGVKRVGWIGVRGQMELIGFVGFERVWLPGTVHSECGEAGVFSSSFLGGGEGVPRAPVCSCSVHLVSGGHWCDQGGNPSVTESGRSGLG
jgi:hypothetical protein